MPSYVTGRRNNGPGAYITGSHCSVTFSYRACAYSPTHADYSLIRVAKGRAIILPGGEIVLFSRGNLSTDGVNRRRHRRGPRALGPLLMLGALLAALVVPAAPAQAVAISGGTGFQDESFGTVSAPTGQKPESKLWHAGGTWYGVLWNVESSPCLLYTSPSPRD